MREGKRERGEDARDWIGAGSPPCLVSAVGRHVCANEDAPSSLESFTDGLFSVPPVRMLGTLRF